MMCIVAVLHAVYFCKSENEIKLILNEKGGGESAIFDIEERVRARYKNKYGIEMPKDEIERFDFISVDEMLFWWLTEEECKEATRVAKLWERARAYYEWSIRN